MLPTVSRVIHQVIPWSPFKLKSTGSSSPSTLALTVLLTACAVNFSRLRRCLGMILSIGKSVAYSRYLENSSLVGSLCPFTQKALTVPTLNVTSSMAASTCFNNRLGTTLGLLTFLLFSASKLSTKAKIGSRKRASCQTFCVLALFASIRGPLLPRRKLVFAAIVLQLTTWASGKVCPPQVSFGDERPK